MAEHWEALEIRGGKRDIRIAPPLMNAAGSLGFGYEPRRLPQLDGLGALVTNPISLSRRSPAGGTRFVPFEGGFLLHTGHPNPGCARVIQSGQKRWEKIPVPVIPHLLAHSEDELLQMMDRLEPVENVQAIELGLLAAGLDLILNLVFAAQSGELPVIANLPLNFDPEKLPEVAGAGADALSMGPPRGMVVTAAGERLSGRLYGPHLLPSALQALERWRAETDLPVIAGGGVYRRQGLQAMFALGASAVQLDSILWTEPESLLTFNQAAGD